MRKLKKYKPTAFITDGSHYDKDAADYAVSFIEALSHTKGSWAGKPFDLIGWQPHLKKQWCIPSKYSGEFVAKMEDVLEVYGLPYDPEIPLVCMDEKRSHISCWASVRNQSPWNQANHARRTMNILARGRAAFLCSQNPLRDGDMLVRGSVGQRSIGRS